MKIWINDTIDLQAEFGITALAGYLKAVVTPPVLKAFEKTEWKDEHGTDYDTSEPVFEARTLSIPFYAKTQWDYQQFITYLEQHIETRWTFDAINRSYVLRLTGSSNVSQLQGTYRFTLTFSEDKPMEDKSMEDYVYETPSAELKTGYKVDDMDFGCFGIQFLKGHVQEIEKPFPIKPNLKIASNQTLGLEYPDKKTYYGPKPMKLPILFKGNDHLQMLDTLVWHLTRAGYRQFGLSNGETFPFIYKNVEIVEFTPGEWLRINLNLELQIDQIFDVLIDAEGHYVVDDSNSTITQILQDNNILTQIRYERNTTYSL
jgi:hypothetical protein